MSVGMTPAAIPPETLAAGLAARILHDIAGPASGVASAMELYADTDDPGTRDAALGLATSSVSALLDMLDFSRRAFGGAQDPLDDRTLRRLASTQFEGRRARLEMTSDLDPFPGPVAQAVLILAHIAAGGLAAGGFALLTAARDRETVAVRVAGEGPGARLAAEVVEGLAGRPLSTGLAGRWAPARYLFALVATAAGELTAVAGENRFVLDATLPLRTV